MKKFIATFTTGLMIVGASVSTVSAEEHVVQKGDNLWEIANTYETTVGHLVEMNDLETTVIQPKQKLTIDDIYTVEKGDTLYSIAKKHNVSVKDIKDWNDMDSEIILIGQELHIKSGSLSIEKEPTNQTEETQESTVKEQAQETKPAEETSTNKKEAKEEPVTKQEETKEESVTKSEKQENPEGKTMTVTATAYTAACNGCTGITATGIDLNKDRNAKVIAVDPNVIPLGSKVYVEGYGQAIAGDTGGAIKGNKIDIHVPTKSEANKWGVRTVDITIIE